MYVMVKKVNVLDPQRIFFIFAMSKIQFRLAEFYEMRIAVFGQFYSLICVVNNKHECFFLIYLFFFYLAIYSCVVISIKKNGEK